jgi:hypothetical protein
MNRAHRKPPHEKRTVTRWYTLHDAAERLSLTADALRRQFERHAIRAKDGGTEAHIDGVRARKFANRWRVSFGESWTG